MSDIRERIIREKAARSGQFYDGERVRCPKCGHAQDANADGVRGQVTWPGRYGDEPGYEETCGKCRHVYEVGVEISVTLVSPAREGGDRCESGSANTSASPSPTPATGPSA